MIYMYIPMYMFWPKMCWHCFLHLFSTGPKRNPIESLSPCLINSEPCSTDSNGEYSKNHWHLWKPDVICKLHQLHQTHITIGTYWSTNQWLSSVQDGRTARSVDLFHTQTAPKRLWKRLSGRKHGRNFLDHHPISTSEIMETQAIATDTSALTVSGFIFSWELHQPLYDEHIYIILDLYLKVCYIHRKHHLCTKTRTSYLHNV
jgi:hypothetical protein